MGRLGRTGKIAAVIGVTTALALFVRPRDPTFELISVNLGGFRLRFDHPSLVPLLDVDLNLTVHAVNPNVVTVRYSPATMSIFCRGSLLGEAHVCAGEHRRNSCRILQIPARLGGLEIAHHLAGIAADVVRREMELSASVRIEGFAGLLWWAHRFRIDVRSRVKVDPLLLDVVEQENRSHLQVLILSS